VSSVGEDAAYAPALQPADDDEWLVIIDPQAIFASPEASPWGSPLWAQTARRIVELAHSFGRERTVVTRFVADAGLGGSWGPYYQDWPFALVPGDDPLYAVVPELRDVAGHVVTAPTFGKWNDNLRAILGEQPRFALAGVSTDCCVIATALPAADAGAGIGDDTHRRAGSTPENHAQAIGAMSLFGPQIVIA
jgi:nicotinamidase-related amidase